MGQKTDKITKHNLGPRILHLLTEEGKNSVEIAKILTGEGFSISQPTVSRWITKERESHRDEVKDIIHDHVSKVIPDDLKALETMEEQCLKWAEEDSDTRSERISAWQKIKDSFKSIRDVILSADTETQDDEMKAFYKRCLNWIIEDLNNQKERLSAMREARSIIDTKLKYAGILEGQTAGNIWITPEKDAEQLSEEDIPPHKQLLHIAGKDNEK